MSAGTRSAIVALLASFVSITACYGQQSPSGAERELAATTIAETPAGLSGLIERARGLLAIGRPDEAYAILAPQVRWYAGSPDFDYLLGISALDSGRPGGAILALERVLLVEPAHLQARAEIGRAYLAANETESARRQFQAVAASPIPPEVRRAIDRYLERIASREDADRLQLAGGLEFGVGWDSNVTLGSRSGQWLLDSGLSVTPEGNSRPVSSAMLLASAGVSAVVPMTGGWELTAGGLLAGRSNPSAHTLDIGSVDFAAGLNYRSSCHRLSMLAQYQHLLVDGASFRDAAGGIAQWRCDIDARTQAGGYVQYFDLRFPDEPVRDARRTLVGATLARVLRQSASPLLVGTAYGGEEVPRQDVPQLRHQIYGVRVAVSAGLGRGWLGLASLSWEHRNYAGEEVLFGTARRDRQTDLRIGAERAIGRHWSIRPDLVYTRNASTIPPNDFRRVQAIVTMRYAF